MSAFLPALLVAGELACLAFAGSGAAGRLYALTRRAGPAGRAAGHLLLAPGVAVHELGHLAAAALTGAKIERVELYRPRQGRDGSVRLGAVEYRPRSVLAGQAAALGPLASGPLACWAACLILVPGAAAGPGALAAAALAAPAAPGTLAAVAVCAALGISAFPSRQDFRVAGPLPWLLAGAAAGVCALASGAPAHDAAALTGPVRLAAAVLAPAALAALAAGLAFRAGRLGS